MWNRFQSRIAPTSYFTVTAAALGALALAGSACDSATDDPQTTGGAAGAGVSGGGQATAGAAQAGQTQVGGTGGQATAGSGGAATGGATAGSSTGGSAGSSGGSGASGAAGSGGSASAGCASGKYLICEDFEATAVGQIPTGWARQGDAKLSGVAEDSAAGTSKHSLKIGAAANGPRRITHPAAALGAAHWGRIRYRVQAPVPDAFVHATFVALQGIGPKNGASEYRMVDTVKEAKPADANSTWCDPKDGRTHCFQWLYNVQPEKVAEFGHAGPYGWQFDDKWHCAEWHIDGATQSYELYSDSKKIDAASFSNGAGKYDNSDIPDSFSELRVGLYNYQSAPPGYTVWIDDIALDEERVGCE